MLPLKDPSFWKSSERKQIVEEMVSVVDAVSGQLSVKGKQNLSSRHSSTAVKLRNETVKLRPFKTARIRLQRFFKVKYRGRSFKFVLCFISFQIFSDNSAYNDTKSNLG